MAFGKSSDYLSLIFPVFCAERELRREMRRFYHSDFPRDIKMDADFVKILEGVCDTPKRILTKSEKVPKAFAFGNSSIIYNIENASFFAGVRKAAFLIYDPFLFRVLRRFHEVL